MKKLLIAFCMLLGFTGVASAQEVAKKATKQTTSKAIPAKATSAGPVKKDGTPDKRFSSNKSTKAAAVLGPVKKDGTPDKRYKANKKN